ncbi:MAG: ATP-binding cassette domain-containing protein [Deltaproteobacteria bacterium]|nr:ATP-binding cassette domain-containing protein [Deltaproteobacteria bacterium]MCB9788754.1 ATP-binding cassette domain-containing protein [Deltaproteobacteria bacterium]
MSGDAVIVCKGVGKRYGRKWIVRDIDLEVRAGELLGLIGPGGHGKSVLLRLLAGLATPDEGEVRVRGKNLADIDPFELAELRREYGYLFQNYALFDFMSVADNVAFPLRQAGGVEEPEIARRVKERLEQLGLGEALDRFPSELSGGMKKRVGMARATIGEPAIVLYDDPSAGLDPVTSSKIFRLVRTMHHSQDDVASVVVSHDIDRMKVICDRYVMIFEGKVLFDGPEEAIEGADPMVGKFFFGSLGQSSGAS